MKTSQKAGIVAVVALVLVIGSVFATYIDYFNYGNRAEKTIIKEYRNMENILSQYSLKVQEVVQLPALKVKDLTTVTQAAFQGRYGEGGSKAVFQWIQENYPGQIDNALYSKVQTIIEAGRNKFENRQTKFLETKMAYVTELDSFWGRMWLGFAGYPKIDLDDYVIISSGHAQKAFEEKVDQPMQLQ